MTAKTGKDEVDEVEAVPAEEQAETEEAAASGAAAEAAEAAAAPARPAAKRKRRVRVIEVIDDEDLDEVLEALDAEDAEAAEAAEAPAEPAAKAAPKPAAEPAAKPAVKTVKPRPAALEPPAEEAEKEPARADAFSLPLVPTAVLAVLIVVLGALAIWQGTSAHSMSSQQDEREAVGKVASAYGDVALNYNAQNYQSQMDKAQKLMGGDLLESFKSNTLPSLGQTFKSSPELALTSKTNQVFVGSVDGRFATAVVMVDITVTTKEGSTAAPATLLRLALGKIDGEWKITKQYASGANDQNQAQQSQLPGTAPSGGASTSPSPKAEQSGKPKN